MLQKLRHIIFNNWFLAALFTLPILLWFNPIKNKYIAKVETIEMVDDNDYVVYADLENDGKSEKIRHKNNTQGNGYVKIYNPGLVGQFNGQTKLFKNSNLLASDTDYDGYKEIYYLGLRNDSVYLNQFDYTNPQNINEYFVTKISAGSDVFATIDASSDLNNDQHDEILFNIRAGFALQPRKIYSFNTLTKEIFKTPLTGAKVDARITQDIDGDKHPEIIDGTFTTNNYGNTEIPYTDMASWVMVFDNLLQFKFPPVKITDKKSTVVPCVFHMNEENFILAIECLKSDYRSANNYYIINSKGETVYSNKIPLQSNRIIDVEPNILTSNSTEDQPKVIDHEGNVFELKSNFEFKKIRKIPDFQYSYLRTAIDIDGDNQKEYLFKMALNKSYVIADPSLNHLTYITIPSTSTNEQISVNFDIGKHSELIIQSGTDLFHIPYYENPLWDFRFFIYATIFFALYALLWLIQYIQKENIKRQLYTQQQIKELQFKVISAQLNPHFTFNALNSLSHAVYNPENPELYDRFTNFSRLIRTMLTDTDKNYRTLENEIKLTRDFLEIQKFHFKNAFDYTFKIDTQVDLKTLVPKLIIQLFVENAIKHAFPNHKGTDHIRIIALNKKEIVQIEVIDNGIGRIEASQRAKQNPENSTGIGLKVMKEFIQLLNESNKNKIRFSIFDLNENLQSTGTRVLISIPKDFRFE